jgi:hypothetical protein
MADSTSALDQLTAFTANNELRANETFDALSPAALYARRASTSTGLTWGFYGGRIDGTSIAAGTVTVSNATNYVVALKSTGAVSTSTTTTNWNNPALYRRLYQVVASGSQVTSYQDHRFGARGVFGADATGRVAIWVPASDMAPSATGGCAALATVATSADRPDVRSLDFDSTTAEYAQFTLAMPKRWDLGTVTFKPVWSHAATTVNFGVVWRLQGVALSDDDAMTTSYGSTNSSTDTGGTTNDNYVGPESGAITIGGTPAAEDIVYFRVSRLPTDGADTMAIDARLHGYILFINTIAENDT